MKIIKKTEKILKFTGKYIKFNFYCDLYFFINFLLRFDLKFTEKNIEIYCEKYYRSSLNGCKLNYILPFSCEIKIIFD